MGSPGIKGSTVKQMFEDLRKYIAEGTISQADVDRHLSADDVELLNATLSDSGWYDVAAWGRAAELLRETVGNGSNAFLFERGKQQGQRLMDAGLYQQMEYAGRAQIVSAGSPEERAVAFRRDLKLLVTLSGSILNFTKWTVVDDPDHEGRGMIEVSEAGPFPEPLIHSTAGLMDCLSDAMGTSGLWKWDRPTPDLIRFRMTRSP